MHPGCLNKFFKVPTYSFHVSNDGNNHIRSKWDTATQLKSCYPYVNHCDTKLQKFCVIKELFADQFQLVGSRLRYLPNSEN
jgi:hypothetical protein